LDLIVVSLPLRNGGFSLPIEFGDTSNKLSVETEGLTLHSNAGADKYFVSPELIVLLAGDPKIKDSSVTAGQLATDYAQRGQQCLTSIEGHYCAVILDGKQQQIFAATDKFATHNLFYQCSETQFLLSTKLAQIKANSAAPLTLSKQSIYNYIYYHCIPSPNTIYQDVYKLEPARLLSLKDDKLDMSIYWTPQFCSAASNKEEDGLQQGLRDALAKATKDYANNEKVGAFLSGGLDSSSVTAFLAANSDQAINTFTIGFSEPGYDEKEFAQAVADKFGSNHTVYNVTPSDIFEYLPKIAAYYDEPFGNSSALPTFFCAKVAKEKGMTIMLAGDGGDELFAGNERYAKQKVFERFTHLPGVVKGLLSTTVPLVAKILPLTVFKKAESYLYQANLGLPNRLQHYNFLHQNPVESVFSDDFLTGIDQQQPVEQLGKRYKEIKGADAVDNMLYLDWKFTLADNDLMKVNYMTEFAGIEVKYPMLTDDMVELCCKLPAEVKLPGQQLRAFYKSALSSVLPDSTINKSKQGFGLPFGKWLEKDENLKQLASTTLESLKKRNIIRPEFIDHAQDMHQNVHAHYYGELVWIMIMLELWLQSH
jgi:asparagine synthase (glutamine-hydrolysing)